MHKLISLKHISVSSVSPKKQKRVQITNYSESSCPNSPNLYFPVFHRHSRKNNLCSDFQLPSTSDSIVAEIDIMPIPVSDELREWLHSRNLQGFIRVAEADPHPQAEELVQELDITKITTKKVRNALQMPRGGFDAVQKPSSEALRSYFGEYSPSAKAYQTYGGRDEFFHEVARFLLEVGFVSPRFYCMPKKRAGFIIAAYEKEDFNWPLLSAEALREQLQGVKTGKPMKQIFGRWLSVLFPIQESEAPAQSRRPPTVQAPRRHRQVAQEEWIEEESAHADNVQMEMDQSEPVRLGESENIQPTNEQERQSEDQPSNQQQSTEDRQQKEKELPHQEQPQRRRVKQKANRQFRPENSDESASKRQRTKEQEPSITPVNTEVTTPVNMCVPTQLQKGQSSKITTREAHGFSDIPPAAHELAAILQFGTSYELVEWLARRLTEVSARLAQEHHDRVMIQKSLRGMLEPQEKAEVEKIGRKRNAQNRGEAIEMPPLHEALVEVHREYEKASKAASDMAERYKSVSASAEELKRQYCNVQKENEKMKESLVQWETQARSTVSELDLQQKLAESKKAQQAEATRANTAEFRTKELEEQLKSIKKETDKGLEEKEHLIKNLQKQLEETQTENQKYMEQIDEFEKYVVSQETRLAEKDQIIEEVNNKITQLQADWNTEKSALEQQLDEVRKISEQRRLDIYVVEAKRMQAEGENRAIVSDLRKQLETAQFDASITKEKVQAIVGRHRSQTKKMIEESLDKGWKIWSAQAAELQLLRADRDNRRVQGPGFFKMAQKDIDTVHEDITKDIDEIAGFYKEEIHRIMQEFDKHDIRTSVHLDKIEAERISKTPGLKAPDTAQPGQPTEQAQSKPAPDDESDTDDDEAGMHPRPDEPSIFDILNDSDEEQQE